MIGIDGSEKMAETARAIVAANGLQGTVTILQGKVEEIKDLGVDKVRGKHCHGIVTMVMKRMPYMKMDELSAVPNGRRHVMFSHGKTGMHGVPR